MAYWILLITIISRRTCVDCGASFNLVDINKDGYVMTPLKPKVDGVCDACGGKLVIRTDDT